MSEAAEEPAEQQPDQPWPEPEHVYPRGEDDGPEVIERYGPGPGEVIVWDTTSNYARIRQLRLQGMTVPEIAAALELKPSTVRQSLTNQVKAESARLDGDEITSILQMELERLDHGVQAHWFAYKAGDMGSLKAMMAISRERREWLKWAQPEPTNEIGVVQNILVIGGSESEFMAGLEAARERLEAENTTFEQIEKEEPDGQPDNEE